MSMKVTNKVTTPSPELLAQVIKLGGHKWAYPERPSGGKPALNVEAYRGIQMQRLLSILRLRRDSYNERQLDWFEPMLESAMIANFCPVFAWQQDDYGNVFVLINDDTSASDVAFTCHLDTVASPKAPWDSGHDIMLSEGGVLYLKHDTQADCLGADDGAGIFLMLEMIRAGVPGRYCFFQDEEVGRQGSEFSAKDDTGFWTGVNHMISFDRRGAGVVNSQLSGVCCSDVFALELATRLGRPTTAVQAGIYTDSASFMHIIPECTNIGVGYNDEHTQDETLDLNILAELLPYVVNPDTWRDLPVQRVPVQEDYFSFTDTRFPDYGLDTEAPESVLLGNVFREISQMGKQQMLEWIRDNPNTAASYLMVFSDFGFRDEILEVGNKVCHDWSGFNNMLKDNA